MAQEFNVILVAAGSGTRLASQVPKQYLSLNGKMVCEHALEMFHCFENMKHCVLVVNKAHETYYKPLLERYDRLAICEGGEDRTQSVYNGLCVLDQKQLHQNVLIHDAARPFVDKSGVSALIEALDTKSAVSLSVPIVDTIRYANDDNIAGEMIDRSMLRALQTPQGFHFECIKNAHEWSKSQESSCFTDDTSVVSAYGEQVSLIEGTQKNFKITTAQDLERAKQMAEEKLEMRIGQGFDVHAFDEAEADHVILCGVKMPHTRKLKGHSDADVGLHTLTDALYGALGAGDIGTHFPPSDMTFKDMDSAIFLEHAMQLLRDRGGRLVNADITLICEAPKLGPHREAIMKRLSEIMKVSLSRLNVKATTTEQLGFTGRREGIAAQAVVCVELPLKAEEE